MPIQAIVFDFDGVLADSEPLHLRVYQELLEPQGIHLDQATYCARYLGFDDVGRVPADCGGLRAPARRRGDRAPDRGEVAAVSRRSCRAATSSIPARRRCVRRLGAAWPLGIASGALRAEIELMLRGAGLLDAFAFIVSSGDTDQSKPAPDPYLRAAELHGVAGRGVRGDRGFALGPAVRPRRRHAHDRHHPHLSARVARRSGRIVDSLDELTVDSEEARTSEAESWS